MSYQQDHRGRARGNSWLDSIALLFLLVCIAGPWVTGIGWMVTLLWQWAGGVR